MNKYPGVADRVKAVFMDQIAIVIMMVLAKQLFQLFDNVPDTARAAVFIFIWGVYEPLCLSLFGKTLGHAANGMSVRQENNDKHLNFFIAFIRLLIKYFLGLISLLTVLSNEKRKAIHDNAVGSVVVYKN